MVLHTLGSYYTYILVLLYVMVDFFPEVLDDLIKNPTYWVFLLLHHSSYYMYWLENFPPFTNTVKS